MRLCPARLVREVREEIILQSDGGWDNAETDLLERTQSVKKSAVCGTQVFKDITCLTVYILQL